MGVGIVLLLIATYLIEILLGAFSLLYGSLLSPGISILLYAFFLFAAFAYHLAKDWWRSEQQKALLASEKLAAELNYLKAQLNPHFLFNTLNNLYALAERAGDENLSDGIASLAELMRYAVYESRADYVPLSKELRFLQSMVEMESLRFDEKEDVHIAFQVSGPHQQLEIAPLLLVPFVENAFKHGIRYGRQSVVRIKVVAEGHHLLFQASNTLHHQEDARPHENKAGIGLENARRRLGLIYPGLHELNIETKDGLYSINLQIELHGRQQ